MIRNGLNPFLVLLVIFLSFLMGCAVAPRTAPVATATISPTAARTAAIPTTTPSPSSTAEDFNPLRQALEALRSVTSVRIRTAYYEAPEAQPVTPFLTTDMRYSSGPPEQIQLHADWGDGLEEDGICLGMAGDGQCWSQVGQHPWTVRRDLEPFLNWLGLRQQELTATTIISSTILPESNEMLVAWSRPIPPEAGRPRRIATGQTWLEASTFLPVREVVTEQSIAEQPLNHTEAIYSDYNAPLNLEAPAVATVTPVPTVVITPRAPAGDPPTREDELPFAGVLFLPDRPGPLPAVVVLHGSEGNLGYSQAVAQRLAQNGFAALALCYFGCPGTPETLKEVNVEKVMQAVDYLKSHPDVRSEAVAVLGISRGAELALIAGALDPDVHAVISVMGAPWVIEGFPLGGTAWLYQRQPLPFRNIPVEQVNGPVLVLHGLKDDVWPVDFSYLVADRLAAHGRPYELAVYSDRGHNIGLYPSDAFKRIVNFLDWAFQ